MIPSQPLEVIGNRVFTKDDFITFSAGNYLIGTSRGINVYVDDFSILKYPITNSEFLEFLKSYPISNEINCSYRWINTDHINSKVKRPFQKAFSEKGGIHFTVGSVNQRDDYFIINGYEHHPVVCINWYGSQLFAKYGGFRLPTEIEWEIAARSGKFSGDYEWGEAKPTLRDANFAEFYGETTHVCSFPPNESGLFDMTGNVREWCENWLISRKLDKLEEDENLHNVCETNKVIRGCGWNRGLESMPCYIRTGKWPRIGGANIGFRVVCDHH